MSQEPDDWPMDLELSNDLPRSVVAWVLVACVTPMLLGMLGVDFGVLRGGSYVHTLLEWSAFCAAVGCVALAMVHYQLERDAVTPVIGLALFAAGAVDAVHTLAADGLIPALAKSSEVLASSWAISRIFNAGTILVVAGIFLAWPRDRERPGMRLVLTAGALFSVSTALVLMVLISTSHLPTANDPDAFIKQPWDVFPLMLYLLAGAIVLPRFQTRYPGVFTQALMLSVIPQVVCQFHMIYGSRSHFDHHSNAAHLLKIVAYLVPFVGLCIDYVRRLRLVRLQSAELQRTLAEIGAMELAERERAAALETLNRELVRINGDLEQFTYVASHDLKAPLRSVSTLTEWIAEDLADGNHEEVEKHLALLRGRVKRMEMLLADLLKFARISRENAELQEIDVGELVRDLVELTDPPEGIEVQVVGEMPTLFTAVAPLEHIFLNLISNAIKHHDRPQGLITVSCDDVDAPGPQLTFRVTDDGPGIPKAYRKKIFRVFSTLRPRDEVESSGMGLAIVKKIVESADGTIHVEGASEEDPRGVSFVFTWPRLWDVRTVAETLSELPGFYGSEYEL